MSLGPLILVSLALGLAAWLLFVWTVKSGQYEDPEGPKYRMMDDDDGRPASPAGPPAGTSGTRRQDPPEGDG